MRKTTVFLLFGMVLASLGFAATAIGSHGGWWRMLTGTTATTTMTSTNPEGRHVFLCHFTGRHHGDGEEFKFHEVTIVVGQPAVWSHLHHGDELGACPPGQTTTGSENDGDADDMVTTSAKTTTAPMTTTTTSDDDQGENDDSGDDDSGGSWDHHGQVPSTSQGQGQGSFTGTFSGQGHHDD